jgi:hypothetical protein
VSEEHPHPTQNRAFLESISSPETRAKGGLHAQHERGRPTQRATSVKKLAALKIDFLSKVERRRYSKSVVKPVCTRRKENSMANKVISVGTVASGIQVEYVHSKLGLQSSVLSGTTDMPGINLRSRAKNASNVGF